MSLEGKTIFMTGGSRGIGLAIALKAARDGANIAIAAKTVEKHRHLPGTIHTAAEEIEKAGGKALPLAVDVRNDSMVVAHTSAKLVMAMCTAGMAEEFRKDGIAFNSLWPRTGIATAAIEFAVSGKEGLRSCRTVDIMADAAYVIFNKNAREFTGNFCIDDIVLYEAGERDFDKYRVDPTRDLGSGDYMIPETMLLPPGVSLKAVRKA